MGGSRDSDRRRPAAAASLAERTATFVLASVPHASSLFAEVQAPALASLLVLSDTVRACAETLTRGVHGGYRLAVIVPSAARLACRCAAQVRHVFAGTAARTMAQALIHPLDTVKTRLQVLPHAQDDLCLAAFYHATIPLKLSVI